MIKCPNCGNTTEFKEIIVNSVNEATYAQDKDGKFEKIDEEVNPDTTDEIEFRCGKCGEDLTEFHQEFLDNLM